MRLLVAIVAPREVWMSCSPVGVVCMWVRVPIRIALSSRKVGHIINLFLLTKGIAYLAILRRMTSGAQFTHHHWCLGCIDLHPRHLFLHGSHLSFQRRHLV